jgi:hypothetical protein
MGKMLDFFGIKQNYKKKLMGSKTKITRKLAS